jgi:vesicle coat complex subunit
MNRRTEEILQFLTVGITLVLFIVLFSTFSNRLTSYPDKANQTAIEVQISIPQAVTGDIIKIPGIHIGSLSPQLSLFYVTLQTNNITRIVKQEILQAHLARLEIRPIIPYRSICHVPSSELSEFPVLG